MFSNIKHWIRNYQSDQAHKLKIDNIKRQRKRDAELCMTKYGKHNWEGRYESVDGTRCSRCDTFKRHWLYGGGNC